MLTPTQKNIADTYAHLLPAIEGSIASARNPLNQLVVTPVLERTGPAGKPGCGYNAHACSDLMLKRNTVIERRSPDNGETEIAPWLIARVRCSGKLHSIAVHDRGRIVLMDHPKHEVRALRTLQALGDESCGCLKIMDALIAELKDRHSATVRVPNAFRSALTAAVDARKGRRYRNTARNMRGHYISRYANPYIAAEYRGFRTQPLAQQLFGASATEQSLDAEQRAILAETRKTYWSELARARHSDLHNAMSSMVRRIAPYYGRSVGDAVAAKDNAVTNDEYGRPRAHVAMLRVTYADAKPFVHTVTTPQMSEDGGLLGWNTTVMVGFNSRDWRFVHMNNAQRVVLGDETLAYASDMERPVHVNVGGKTYATARMTVFYPSAASWPTPPTPRSAWNALPLEERKAMSKASVDAIVSLPECRFESRVIEAVAEVGVLGPILWFEKQ